MLVVPAGRDDGGPTQWCRRRCSGYGRRSHWRLGETLAARRMCVRSVGLAAWMMSAWWWFPAHDIGTGRTVEAQRGSDGRALRCLVGWYLVWNGVGSRPRLLAFRAGAF